jgi:hypothetical protein
MESAGPLARTWTAADLRGARIALAGWALWMTAAWTRDVASAFFRLQLHRSASDAGAHFGLYLKSSWGTVAAAELLVAAALVPLARALAESRTRLLIWVACGSAAGGALLIATALAASLPQPLVYLQQALRAAAPASFVWASARVLRSDDTRLSWTLLGAALLALAVRAGEALMVAREPDRLLLAAALGELDVLSTALPVVAAYFLVQHARRAGGDLDPRRTRDPYRIAEPSGEDAASRERRREGCAAADRLRIHGAAACVYGASAAAGIALFAYQESWHKFYANAAVIEFTSSLHAAALLVMAATIPRRGGTGPGSEVAFLGRWSTALALALELTAYAMMSLVSRPLGSTSGMGDEFRRLLAERDARFTTAALLALLGSALTLVTIARLAASFKRIATSADDAALARRASQLTLLAGLLAASLVGATLLDESGSYEIVVALGSLKRSSVVQAALAAVVLAIAAGHAIAARGVARIPDLLT